jgi:ribosomal protein L16/L10AE
MLDQGRISDTHLDVSRNGLRRALKTEKGSKFWMRIFPDRPVTSKVSVIHND